MSMREAWSEPYLRRFLIAKGINTWGILYSLFQLHG
jgi:hypothetical protein